MSELPSLEVKAFVRDSIGTDIELHPLRAPGANNGIYLAQHGGERWVVKMYGAKRVDSDPLRLEREIAFYRHLEVLNVQCCPRLLAHSIPLQTALLTYSKGSSALGMAAEEMWQEAALDFVSAIQGRSGFMETQALLPAGDSCQKIADHLTNVDRRIRDAGPYVFSLANEFHAERIVPTWELVLEWATQKLVRQGQGDKVPQLVSPGDFGLHNSIVTESHAIEFLDFEHAGWDDPVKFLCDLEFQPSNDFSQEQMSRWVKSISQIAGASGVDDRYRTMRPVHAVKWASIVLNAFGIREATSEVQRQVEEVKSAGLLSMRLAESDRLLRLAQRALKGFD